MKTRILRFKHFLFVINSVQQYVNSSKMIRNSTLTSKLTKQISNTLIYNIKRKMSSDASDVMIQNIGNKGVIVLNRPKALNALNLSMVKKIYPILKEWETSKTLVIVKGAGEKAFCAGGDVRAVVEAGLKGEKLGHEYFKQEYTTNGLIGLYKIPYIALIDGIVMGGGVGLSIHGQYRVATERTLFAMPETQIGLFPDVGGSYFLPRLSGKLGWYLSLTGHRLKGVDVVKAGIATHYCESQNLKELEDSLLKCSNKQDIETTLSKFNKPEGAEFSLAPVMEKINYCFSAQTVEEIFAKLERDGSKWAESTLNILRRMSPTSLKVTFKELEFGKQLTLQECLQMEYRIAVNCLENKDFYEGVRALLIDKDQNPKWNPPTLAEVSEELVNSHFSKIPQELELKNKL